MFTEPLSKKWYWETFLNYSQISNEVDRQATDPSFNNNRIDSLSVFYNQNTHYQRAGTSLRYSYKGMNATAGLAMQQIILTGEYARQEGQPLLTNPVDRTFNNLTPNVDVNYEFANNTNINFNYGYGITAPSLNDLQPVPNINNPAFRIEGNPNLSPERMHSVAFNVNKWNAANFSYFGVGTQYQVYDSQIVYNQTIEQIDSIGIRTATRPDNVSGGNTINLYTWFSFPIIKTKLTVNGGPNASFGQTPAFVNGVLNETRNNGYGGNIGFNLTPGQKLILGLSGDFNFNDLKYSIQQEQNQRIQNHTASASIKWQFADKFFLESNFNYSFYRNDRFGFNRSVPLWNASVRRLLGKTNRIETRLAAFDLLNRQVNITQTGTQNYITRVISNTLAQYFMLSVSYNVRGYENKVNKNNWW